MEQQAAQVGQGATFPYAIAQHPGERVIIASHTDASARSKWAHDYREARKLARFIETFHSNLRTLPVSERTFPQLRGFCFTRLSGDQLHWLGHGVIARSARCHHSLLACLRYVQPRLPA